MFIFKNSFSSNVKQQYKLDHFFLMSVITIFLVCDTTAFRMTPFMGSVVPVSGLILPIVFALGDMVADVYGYSISRKMMIWNTVICQVLFGLTIRFALSFSSPQGNTINYHYEVAFNNILWTNFTSCLSITSGMFVNAFLMSKLKVRMHGKHFLFRTIMSSSISEFVLCFVAYNILYFWTKNFGEIWSIIIAVWWYKVIFAILASPIVWFVSKTVKYYEGIDKLDIGINYNPFRYIDENQEIYISAANDSAFNASERH
ncbi:VUT family protein (plasmid) [Legionella sp. D16C41]|uniref:VUT family protein n=1 Tax=Legionella sp. D16C41 TaxID=3402688 RepID=UPI003AF8FFFB